MPDENDKIIHVQAEVVDDATPQASQGISVRPTEQEIEIQAPQLTYGLAEITDEESKALSTAIDPELVEIRPDGLLYLPGNVYREMLTRIIGAGQWSLRMLDQGRLQRKYDWVFWYQGELWIRGSFVAEAIGEQAYKESNPNSSWVTAREGAKTDCLVRCCKDLGIANELWNPQFTKQWKDKYAMPVKMTDGQQEKWFWFKKGDKPYQKGWRVVQ